MSCMDNKIKFMNVIAKKSSNCEQRLIQYSITLEDIISKKMVTDGDMFSYPLNNQMPTKELIGM